MLNAFASDGICTTPMCDAGKASVDEMNAVFMQLGESAQSNFGSSVNAINSAFGNIYSWYSDWIPFNPDCCTMQALGAQADNLTNQMQQALGVVPTGAGPGSTGAGMSLTSMILLGVVGFLALSHVANRV